MQVNHFNYVPTTILDLAQIDEFTLLELIKKTEKDKQTGDLNLKKYFVKKVADKAITIIFKNVSCESILHDHYFSYYFPNGKGKYISLNVDYQNFSYGPHVDLDCDANKVKELQNNSQWACYQFLRDCTIDELVRRRSVPLKLIEPSIENFQESPLIRTAVLSVMECMEKQEAKLSLTGKQKPILKNETLWQDSNSWEPLSDPWGPNSNDEIDTTLDDLMREKHKKIRASLIDLVKNKVLQALKLSNPKKGEKIQCDYQRSRINAYQGFEKFLAEFNESVKQSPVTFSEPNLPTIPVKLVCYNSLLKGTDYHLREDGLYVHFIQSPTKDGNTDFLRLMVIGVMREMERDSSMAPLLTDKALWLEEYRYAGNHNSIIEEPNCTIL